MVNITDWTAYTAISTYDKPVGKLKRSQKTKLRKELEKKEKENAKQTKQLK